MDVGKSGDTHYAQFGAGGNSLVSNAAFSIRFCAEVEQGDARNTYGPLHDDWTRPEDHGWYGEGGLGYLNYRGYPLPDPFPPFPNTKDFWLREVTLETSGNWGQWHAYGRYSGVDDPSETGEFFITCIPLISCNTGSHLLTMTPDVAI